MCTGTGCRDDSGSGRLCAVAFCSTVERAGAGTAVICNISCVCYNMDGVVSQKFHPAQKDLAYGIVMMAIAVIMCPVFWNVGAYIPVMR